MKIKLKIFLTIISTTLLINVLFSQSSKEPLNKIDSSVKLIRKEENIKQSEQKFQDQITELNKQVSQLTQTVADTKQTFYDSKLNLWNFILTAFGLLVVIAGYFGYKSISDKIQEIKTDGEKAILKSEETVKEIKTDLVQRITEIKDDIRDFKNEQKLNFEKFDREANQKIEKGLNSALQDAIAKIMEGTFSTQLNEFSEQLSELRNKVENLTKVENTAPLQSARQEANEFDGDESNNTTTNNNAFDE